MAGLIVASGMRVERLAPGFRERRANGVWREHGRERQRSGNGGDDQADRENGAAMRVDAAGDGQHAALGFDPERDEALVEGPAGAACRGEGQEGGQQRIGRPAHQVEVHVGMGAGIDRADEARFGIGL